MKSAALITVCLLLTACGQPSLTRWFGDEPSHSQQPPQYVIYISPELPALGLDLPGVEEGRLVRVPQDSLFPPPEAYILVTRSVPGPAYTLREVAQTWTIMASMDDETDSEEVRQLEAIAFTSRAKLKGRAWIVDPLFKGVDTSVPNRPEVKGPPSTFLIQLSGKQGAAEILLNGYPPDGVNDRQMLEGICQSLQWVE